MSEMESRPTRGRSSTRGGRSSYGRGGPRGGRSHANGHATEPVEESFEEQGELGEMKKKYQSELGMLKDMFPDWTDTDLVFALDEADGDIPATVDKITQGAVSQFSEVKKPKDRARSKAKEDITPASFSDKTGSGSRARGRGGLDSTRGGRARGTERGRGGHRGGRGGHAITNGTATDISAPIAEHSTQDTPASTDAVEDSSAVSAAPATTNVGEAASKSVVSPPAGADVTKASAAQESGAKKSWASMFAQPKPVPAAVPKKAATPQPAVAELPVAPTQSEAVAPEAEEATQTEPTAVPEIQEVLAESAEVPAERPETSEGDAANLTPSTVPLTEANVEELPDDSVPPATFTAASTTGSMDPRNLTPLPQAPIGRPALGGFATSANRLAGTGGRTASFQRRLKEQQEAVVMPGHSAVDRATVQFGSMGLSGEQGMDVDEEREEPETRQAPQHSPPSQPRTSLPPAPRHGSDQPEVVPSAATAVPTPKQAPGLPPASAQNQQQIQDPSLGQPQSHEPQASQYGQYGRYNQPGLQPDLAAQSQQKQHYDPFGHQTQSQYDQYGGAHSQHQPHAQQQQQQQSSLGGLSSGPNDYPGYYTSEQQRLYSPYGAYGSYGQPDSRSQSSQNQQDPSAIGQQRSASGFGSAQGDSAFGGQTQGQQAPSRFGDTHGPGSGNNTPNPPLGGQQQHQQSAPQSQHSQQGAYAGAGSGFPYGHQYYNSPYPQAYQAQFYQPTYGSYGSQGNKGYGGNPYSGNQSMGSQSYESSSPAPGAPFGQTQSTNRAASGSSALLDDYNRGSSAQGFNGMNDFSQRSSSGFGSHGYNGQQQGLGGNTQPESSDALKPFGNDTSSSKSGPAQRPGSAVGSQQSGNVAPQQSQHNTGNFGGYQNYSGQGQYLGGLGAQQSGQSAYGGQQSQGGYAGYGAGGFNQTYGQGYGAGGNARGGWGQNYSQGQH